MTMTTLLLILVLAQDESLATAKWRVEEVGDGVTWRYVHFQKLFGSPQSVSVLDVDLASGRPRIRFARAEKGRERTSAMAARTKAVAAVNGGFFNTKNGDPIGLLKIDGAMLSKSGDGGWALGIDAKEKAFIDAIPADADWKKAEHAMSSYPILVQDGVRRGRPNKPRHPRTAVGLTPRGEKLILLTVDGRTPQSAGMTEEELAQAMLDLGCEWALNLDGGGSTTLWIRGEPDGGIANFPCDNGKFDHAGERAVADCVLVVAPDVVMGDTDEAVLEPRDAWKRSSEGAGFCGADYAVAAAPATARWKLAVEAAGTYEVFVRWPKGAKPGEGARVVAAGTELQVGAVNAGGWVSAGRIRADAAGPVEVELRATVADAVRLVER
jgi:hypothetical protein